MHIGREVYYTLWSWIVLFSSAFKDIIQVHFAIQRDAILRQCSTWLREAVSPEHERRLRKAVDELRAELDKL